MSSETFRQARPEEIDETAIVVSHSFVGRSPEWYQEILRQPVFGGGIETVWIAADGSRIAGACQLHPLHQWIGGGCLPVMGMATVTVAPTHRRRGLAGRLVTTGMRHARERGDAGTALYPFRISFYERLGYARAGEAHQYRVPPEVIPDAPERLGVELADSPTQHAELKEVYRRWAESQTGQLDRTDALWTRVLDPPGRAAVLYRNEQGAAEGYAVVRYRTDMPAEERFLEVEERAWLTSRARRGLYAWLGSLGDQWRQLVYRAHVEERFGDRIEEPRIPPGSEPGWNLWYPSAVLLRGPMFRILDLERAFAARPQLGNKNLTLGLEVEDQVIAENAGHWTLRLDEGVPVMQRGEPASPDAKMRVKIDTLSRIFVGALTPSEAVNQNAIWIEPLGRLADLNAAFRLPRPWTFDAF